MCIRDRFNLEVNVQPAVGVMTDASGNVLNAATLGVDAEDHDPRRVVTGPPEDGNCLLYTSRCV